MPEQFAIIEETYTGTSDKLIVCVKDHHADPKTQLNIAQLLTELRKENRFNLICLEGASSKLDTSFFNQFPNKTIRNKVAKYFLNKAMFSGSEYYNISHNDPTLKMFGVEDNIDYLQNINIYLDVQIKKEVLEKKLTALTKNIQSIKNYAYSTELKNFDTAVKGYHKAEINLDNYLTVLKNHVHKQKISLLPYEHITKYIKLKGIHKRIKPQQIEKQIYRLDKTFSSFLSQSELKILKNYLLRYKIQGISNNAFLDYIYSLYTYSIIMDYPFLNNTLNQIMLYVEFNALKNSIDYVKMHEEINTLENKLYLSICKTDLQIETYINDKNLSYIEKLCRLSLTSQEINQQKNQLTLKDVKSMVSFINKTFLSLSSNKEQNNENYDSIYDIFNDANQFYKVAEKRNNHFVENTLSKMNEHHTSDAVLITGGFHTKGITDILKQKGISYIIICPKTNTEDFLTSYDNRMTGELFSINFITDFLTQTLGVPLITASSSSEDQIKFAKLAFATLYGISEQLEKFKNDPNWQPFTDSDIQLLTKSIQNILMTQDSINLDTLQKIVHHVILGSKMGDAVPLDEAEYGILLDEVTEKLNTQFGKNGKLAAQELTQLRKNNMIFTIQKFDRGSIGFNSILGVFFRKSALSFYEDRESNIILQTLRYCFELDQSVTIEDIMQNPEVLSSLSFNPVHNRIITMLSDNKIHDQQYYRTLSYALDHLDYNFDDFYAKITNEDLQQALQNDDDEAIQKIFKQFNIDVFIIQNSRNLNRKFACSGQCWYCLACTEAIKDRLKKTQPSDMDSAAAVTKKAIKLGLNNIQITGEDSLDDIESFWKIIDACKEANDMYRDIDNPINLSITTNGFYFLRNADQIENFFQELKLRCGDSINPSIRISFDPGKIKRVKNWKIFSGNEQEVYKAFTKIIHHFNNQFQYPCTLHIVSRDMDTGSKQQMLRNYQLFHETLQNILEFDFGWKEPNKLYSYTRPKELLKSDTIIYYNTEALLRGLKQGRIHRQDSTVEDLFDSIYSTNFQQRFSGFRFFFNMAMNSISDGDLFLEYPMKDATPDKLFGVLLSSLSYPISRRFLMANGDESFDAIYKQLGFAMSINPSLKSKKQVTYEQVLTYISSDETLITQMEQIFLLEDVLYTYDNSKFRMIANSSSTNFSLRNLPQELAISLEDEKIIMAFLTYYARYRMTTNVPEGLKPFVETFYSNPSKAVEDFKFFLNENVLTELLQRNIILPDPLNLNIDGKLSKTASDKPIVDLVDIEKDLGFDLKQQLSQRLLSNNRKTRKTGLNLIGTITNEKYDLNEFKDILLQFAFSEDITDEEKIEFITLLQDWMSDYRVKSFYDKSFFVQIMQSYAINQPYGVKDKALDILLEAEDGTGEFLSNDFMKSYLKKINEELPYLDSATSLKFFAKCYENKLITKNKLSGIIEKIPVPQQPDHFVNEISKQWDIFQELFNFEKMFIDILKLSDIRRSNITTRKFILEHLLSSSKRQAQVLSNIHSLGHKNFVVVLNTLKEMFFFSRDKNVLKFLNSLPMGYFENNSVIEAVFKDDTLQHFLEMNSSEKMTVYLSFMEEKNSATALRNYFKKVGLSPIATNPLPFDNIFSLVTQITENMELNINHNLQNELTSLLMLRLSEFFDPFNDASTEKTLSIYDVIFSDPSIQNPIRAFVKKTMDSTLYQDDITTLAQLFILIQNEIINFVSQLEDQIPPAASKITTQNTLIEQSL